MGPRREAFRSSERAPAADRTEHWHAGAPAQQAPVAGTQAIAYDVVRQTFMERSAN